MANMYLYNTYELDDEEEALDESLGASVGEGTSALAAKHSTLIRLRLCLHLSRTICLDTATHIYWHCSL